MLNFFYDKYIVTGNLSYRHNNFYLMRLPFVIAPSAIFIGLLETGDEDFNRKLYYSCRSSVRKKLLKQFNADFGLRGEKLLNFIRKYFISSGWGMISIADIDFDKKQAIVSVSSSPFASMLHGKVSSPSCHFLRGILAGILSNIFKTEVDCVETHCASLGNNNCQFIVKKKEKFNIENKNVLLQLELDI